METKDYLIEKILKGKAFWSYDEKSVLEHISDDQIIEAVLEKLDLEDIDKLFLIYPYRQVKKVWRDTMAIQGDFYYGLNRFYAWYYFGIKNPDRYLKTLQTKHMNSFT